MKPHSLWKWVLVWEVAEAVQLVAVLVLVLGALLVGEDLQLKDQLQDGWERVVAVVNHPIRVALEEWVAQ